MCVHCQAKFHLVTQSEFGYLLTVSKYVSAGMCRCIECVLSLCGGRCALDWRSRTVYTHVRGHTCVIDRTAVNVDNDFIRSLLCARYEFIMRRS